jgi:hypothetical protein
VGPETFPSPEGALPKKKRRTCPFFGGNFWRFSGLILENIFNGVFELPLLRNAQKRHKKKSQKFTKKKRHLPTPFSGYQPDIRRFQLYFS